MGLVIKCGCIGVIPTEIVAALSAADAALGGDFRAAATDLLGIGTMVAMLIGGEIVNDHIQEGFDRRYLEMTRRHRAPNP